VTYSVADLVVPIEPGHPMTMFPNGGLPVGSNVAGQYSVPSAGGLQGGQFQVGQTAGAGSNPWSSTPQWQTTKNPNSHDFSSLIDLITATCEPNSWAEVAGAGTIKGNETT